MTDQELILDALEQAQLILAEYIEPGAARPPDVITEQLLVLDQQDLAAAVFATPQRRFGISPARN